ncbi:hypothetical protein BVY01_01645, partial [bacterium I07]
IDEGRINRIQIAGAHKTKSFVILREFPLKSGDLFDVEAVERGIDNIYGTGYFQNVRFDVHKNKSGHTHNLDIHLIEHGNTLLRGGMRYDLERKATGFLQIIEQNFMGLGGNGYVIGMIGKRDEMLGARFWTNRLLNSYLTFSTDFSVQNSQYYFYQNHSQVGSYHLHNLQGSFMIGQQMRRLGTLSLRLRSEFIHMMPTSGEDVPLEKFTLVNLTLRSEVDSRDRMPFPSSGNHHIFEYETAGGFMGSQVPYTKIYSTMESFHPLKPGIIFHPKIVWGTADLTTPYVKQFRLGGIHSFMGLPDEAFIGKRFFTVNTEIRTRIPWPGWIESYLTLRYDFGGIWGRYVKISAKDFKHGAGALLSVNTVLGPL